MNDLNSLYHDLHACENSRNDLIIQKNIYSRLKKDIYNIINDFINTQNELNSINNSFKNCTFDDNSYLGSYDYPDVKSVADSCYDYMNLVFKSANEKYNSVCSLIASNERKINDIKKQIKELSFKELRSNYE